ncbi:phage baseplate assembly protein V [Pseudoalteromonas luteoviolacea]|uniref:phage baseplate assembly protein V n=1 Tax=Pseudoalteromonas luteoviolacea TaxID=43657 RepID=UPI001B39F142|nr:phage baseplate assembly protein V [Pseudoalteromonas luteoviolacea]MBQ4878940.1 phage baseplate assembly protein V [Pseudoalteromonas luteoviolacea]MBQ4907883.1 phage baseplate assembly protein V [Pseudoalteromonas luteoviolacea]
MLANQQQSELAVSDMQHRFAKLISIGTVEEVDFDLARVKVRIGEWLTAKLPWLTNQAAQDMTWQAPEVGEQVLVLAPSGDMAQGIVLGSLYANGHEQPHFKMNHVVDATSVTGDELVQSLSAVPTESREHVQRTHYQDGAIVQYDREKHAYDIFVPESQGDNPAQINIFSGGEVNIECKQNANVLVHGETDINGKKNISITATEALNLTGKSVNITSKEEGTNVIAEQGDMFIQTKQGAMTLDSTADTTIKTAAAMTVKAGGVMKLDGSAIKAQEG